MSYSPRNPNGQATMANSSPVTLASDHSDIKITLDGESINIASGTVTITSTDLDIRDLNSATDSVAAVQSGTWNITNISGTISLPTGAATSAKQDTGNTSLSSIDSKTPALGQALAAGSVPVVLTAAQLSTLTPPAAITGYATESTLSTLNGKIPSNLTVTSTRLLVDGSGVTQPVSGTVAFSNTTIDLGATSLAALELIGIKGADGLAIAGNSNPLPISDAGGSLTVDGSVSITGTVTVSQGTAANLNVTEASGSSIATNTSNIATNTTNIPNVIGTAASAIPSKLLQVGGSDGTNARAIKVNTGGQLDIRPLTSSDQITIVPSGTQTVSGTIAFSNTTIATTNAGTFVVQENGDALTSLQLIDDGIVAQGTALGSTKNYLMGGSVTTAAPSYTTGNINPLSLQTNGSLRVAVTDALPAGTNAIGKLSSNTGVTIGAVEIAASQTLSTVTTVTSLTQMNGQAIAMGTGVRSAGTQRVTIATDDIVPVSQSGTWSVRAQDGSGNALTSATRGSERALSVQIVDGSGTQITSFSGGTQYTEGDVDATITGTAMLWEDTGDTLRAVSVAKPLPVNFTNTTIATTNAGSFVVQENGAALTSLQLLDDTIVAQGTALGTTKVGLIGGSVTTSAPTFTTGQINQLSLTTGGGLRVSIADTAANTTAGLISVKFDQTTVGTTNAVSLAQLGANTIATGNGASSTGVLRVAQVNDGTGVLATVTNVATIGTSVTPGTSAAHLGKAEDAQHTTGDVGVMVLGVRQSAETDLSAGSTDADYEPFQLSRKGYIKVIQGADTGTGTDFATGSIAATKTDIGTANTATALYGYYFYNPNSSVAYVQFFNTQASGVTLGTTAPVLSLGIPATSGANIMFPVPLKFSTALSIAITTTRAGSTGVSSTVDYNIFYKQ